MTEYHDLSEIPLEITGRTPCKHLDCPCWTVCGPRSYRIDAADCGTYQRYSLEKRLLAEKFRLRYIQNSQNILAKRAAKGAKKPPD